MENLDLTIPSIRIDHAKMYIGRGCDTTPVTESFVGSVFSRYGDIARVEMVINRSTNPDDRFGTGTGFGTGFGTENYYRIVIHFKRWNIENGEARYVRSILMSSSPNANIKLSYSGPWYWKFSANRLLLNHY